MIIILKAVHIYFMNCTSILNFKRELDNEEFAIVSYLISKLITDRTERKISKIYFFLEARDKQNRISLKISLAPAFLVSRSLAPEPATSL